MDQYFRPSPELAVLICKCGRRQQPLLWATSLLFLAPGLQSQGSHPTMLIAVAALLGDVEESRARCSNLVV